MDTKLFFAPQVLERVMNFDEQKKQVFPVRKLEIKFSIFHIFDTALPGKCTN